MHSLSMFFAREFVLSDWDGRFDLARVEQVSFARRRRWQMMKLLPCAECPLCCSWNNKPSGKPQLVLGTTRDGHFGRCLMPPSFLFSVCRCCCCCEYDCAGLRSFSKLFSKLHNLMTFAKYYYSSCNPLEQVRFNTKTRSVEMKTSPHTVDVGALQKGADFVSAFMMGFEVQDAVALLRLDDLYVESFNVTDVKLLRGDHLSRAIGRVAGQDGKTRFAIENATRTRIVVADQRIHMLGSYANLRVARNAICDLILGAPPGKVYNNMRNVAKRMNERY